MREHGTAIYSSVEADRVREFRTLQCCHCGRHWLVIPGSGRTRGFCMRCGDVTCGPDCPVGMSCVPQEQMLENLEQGRAIDHRQVAVNVPKLWTPGGPET